MAIFSEEGKNHPFASLSPKAAFVAGLVSGVLVLCTIGFFVLLTVLLSGGLPAGAALERGAGRPAAPRAAAPTPPPSPSAGGSVSVKPVSARDHVRGRGDAPVALVEYSDYECPFCKSFHPTIQRLLQERPDQVRWVYRHFPLSFHQNAQKEAEAAECVAELAGNDAFWSFTDKIFERTTSNGTGFALTDLPALAVEVGAARQPFEACLNSGKYATYVQDDEQSGVAAGVTGTPGTILVNSRGQTRSVAGAVPYGELVQAVDVLR